MTDAAELQPGGGLPVRRSSVRHSVLSFFSQTSDFRRPPGYLGARDLPMEYSELRSQTNGGPQERVAREQWLTVAIT